LKTCSYFRNISQYCRRNSAKFRPHPTTTYPGGEEGCELEPLEADAEEKGAEEEDGGEEEDVRNIGARVTCQLATQSIK
jgi:hypothetical protein